MRIFVAVADRRLSLKLLLSPFKNNNEINEANKWTRKTTNDERQSIEGYVNFYQS